MKKFQVYKSTLQQVVDWQKRLQQAETSIPAFEGRMKQLEKEIAESRKKGVYPKDLELELDKVKHDKGLCLRDAKVCREALKDFCDGKESISDLENEAKYTREPNKPDVPQVWDLWCTRCGHEKTDHYDYGSLSSCNTCTDCFGFSVNKKLPYSKKNCTHERLKDYGNNTKAFCKNTNCLADRTDTPEGQEFLKESIEQDARWKKHEEEEKKSPYELEREEDGKLVWVKVTQKGDDITIDLLEEKEIKN